MLKFEREFNQFHGDTLSTEQYPIENLSNLLQRKYPTVPKELITFYSRERLNIRKRHLNENLLVLEKTFKRRENIHISKFV